MDEEDLLQQALREEYAKYRAKTGFPLAYDDWLVQEDERDDNSPFAV